MKLAAFLDESHSSRSEYEDESEDETDGEGELEDEEAGARNKGGKKKKKGVILREQIGAAISDEASPFVDTAKGRVGANQTIG